MRRMPFAWLVLSLCIAGCAGVPQQGSWGARWAEGGDLRSAAVAAARSPRTWAPLAGAALLSATDLDDDVSDWIADERPLFGSDAADASDKLRTAAVAGYLLSALAVPGESAGDKIAGLSVGIVVLGGQGAIVTGLKEVASRRRPNDLNNRSFPSGHTSTASAGAALAARNLAHIDLPPAARRSAVIGLEAIAIGTGWARVEARKHFAADVLAGYALGHFLAAFAQGAFIDSRLAGARVAFIPAEGGGALRLTLPLVQTR